MQIISATELYRFVSRCFKAHIKALCLQLQSMSLKMVEYLLEDMSLLNNINQYDNHEKPYTFSAYQIDEDIRDINYQLAHPPACARKVCSYTTKHAYKQIEDQLTLLHLKNYQFELDTNKRPFFTNENESYVYDIRRAIKLRFKCKNNRCPEYRPEKDDEDEKNRKWTSYYGMVRFRFYFEQKPKKAGYILRINLKVYGQKCFTCTEWGSGSIIEPDLFRLCRLYSNLVEIVMHQRLAIQKDSNLEKGVQLDSHQKYGSAPSTSGRRKDVKMSGRVLKHKESLCEACAEGVCVYFYKPRERIDWDGEHEHDNDE